MATEYATHLAGLNDTKPANTELVAEGDNHLRLIKNVLQTTFPGRGVTDMAPITKTINFVPGVNEVGALYVIKGATTCTLPAASGSAPGLAPGTHYWVWTATADLTVTTSDGTLVNGAASGKVKAGFGAIVTFDGVNWILVAVGPGAPGAPGAGVGTGPTENTWAGENTGLSAAGLQNTAFGYGAMANNRSASPPGWITIEENTAIGASTLTVTEGWGNTALGAYALEDADSACGITALGTRAARNVVTNSVAGVGGVVIGYEAASTATDLGSAVIIGRDAAKNCATISGAAIAIGMEAAMRCVDPWSNIAIGEGAQAFGNTSTYNISVGRYALSKIGSTSQANCKEHTAIGHNALSRQVTGRSQTALGYEALYNATSGNYCTALGYQALYAVVNYDNSTGLGANAAVTGSNQVQLGDAATTTYAYGAVQNRSDARDKADIRSTSLGLAFILALRPVEFRWDYREDYGWGEKNGSKTRSRFHQGFTAQDVKQVLEDQRVDFGGFQDHAVAGGQDVMSLGYTEFIAPLVKAIQELAAEFAEYKRTHP